MSEAIGSMDGVQTCIAAGAIWILSAPGGMCSQHKGEEVCDTQNSWSNAYHDWPLDVSWWPSALLDHPLKLATPNDHKGSLISSIKLQYIHICNSSAAGIAT